ILKDVNDDGQIDLVFTNYDYINVVDGSTARLLWHYKDPDMRRIAYPSVGAFYEANQMDVVYLSSGAMHLVAHSLNPPVPALEYVAAPQDLPGYIPTSLLLGSFIIIVALPLYKESGAVILEKSQYLKLSKRKKKDSGV
ncbi:MAG: hypothetical protein RTV31_15365, partial [Candidatus Thorarchaeota archaeon]